jgi:hypothetical protein
MTVLLDAAGRRRSPVTMPGYHAGRPPGNKGMHYPADPPTVDQIVAVMRHTRDDRHGYRLRGMIVVLWRAGLLHEALALAEHDLASGAGRCWSAAARAAAGARWAWTSGAGNTCAPWLAGRAELPVGPLFCIIDGRTRGRAWSAAAVRSEFRRVAARAGVRRRFAPSQRQESRKRWKDSSACSYSKPDVAMPSRSRRRPRPWGSTGPCCTLGIFPPTTSCCAPAPLRS